MFKLNTSFATEGLLRLYANYVTATILNKYNLLYKFKYTFVVYDW